MRQNFIARSFHDRDLIVGKDIAGTFYGVSRDGNFVQKGSNYERLVVYPSCHITWVDHDSSTGQPLSAGFLIGGILTSTNTPLYVVRLQSESVILWVLQPPQWPRLGRNAWHQRHAAIWNVADFTSVTVILTDSHINKHLEVLDELCRRINFKPYSAGKIRKYFDIPTAKEMIIVTYRLDYCNRLLIVWNKKNPISIDCNVARIMQLGLYLKSASLTK